MQRIFLLLVFLLALIAAVAVMTPSQMTADSTGLPQADSTKLLAAESAAIEQAPPQRVDLGLGANLDFGSLEVQVLDENDLLLKDPYDVTVVPDNALKRADTWKGLTQNGRAVFTKVNYDQEFTVKVTSASGAQMAKLRAAGPTLEQRKTVFILRPTFQKAVLLGRILHEDGTVQSNRGFDCVQRIHAGSNFQEIVSHLRTDNDGRFHYPLEDRFEFGSTRTLTLIQRSTRSQPERNIHLDLSSTFAPEEHNLGDLVMTQAPVLGRGDITNTAGSPVVGARVVLEIGLPSKHALLLDSLAKDDSLLVWRKLHGTEVTTAESGEFLLHGKMPRGRYQISVAQDSYLPGELGVTLGSDSMDVTLLRAWTVEGRCIFDPEVKPEAMYVGILPASDANLVPSEEQAAGLEEDGTFELTEQAEGAHTLVVRALGTENNLFTMPLVLGPEGGTLHLEDIDMRGQFRTITLAVKQEGGFPVYMPSAITLDGTLVASATRSPLVIRTKDASLDLSVHAFQLRSGTVLNLSDDHTITLREGLFARVMLNNAPTLPAGWVLLASLHPVDPIRANTRGATGWQWINSQLTAALSNSGTYELRVMMRTRRTRRNAESKSIFLGESGSWPRFQVEDIRGIQIFHASLDTHALEQAIRLAQSVSSK